MSTEPTRYSNLRDSFTALREFIIVVAMLSLLFAPDRVKNILNDAGIRSLAGVEFDTTALEESEAAVEAAQDHILELQHELKLVKHELSKAADSHGILAHFDLENAIEHLDRAQRQTIETEMNLSRSAEKNLDFLNQHRVSRGQTSGHSHTDPGRPLQSADAENTFGQQQITR